MHYSSILFLFFSSYAAALPLANKIEATSVITSRHMEMGEKGAGFNPDWRRDSKKHISAGWKQGEGDVQSHPTLVDRALGRHR
ncbi:hypothetical protein AX15_001808 [Amanita polypyramis BW_CC]|nr:hypothetical protein AX15_001808 [Amanita polypyramis BW_CC]